MSTPQRPPRRLFRAAAVASLALALVTPAQGAEPQRYASPVDPFSVARLASLPAHDWLPGHRGIDLTALVGGAVTAPASGEVTFAGVVVSRPVVSLRHAGGFISSFEPVDATVRVGDVVDVGDPLGTVSTVASHCSPATCVHWGLRREGRYVNPLDHLSSFGPVRLLPLDGWTENAR